MAFRHQPEAAKEKDPPADNDQNKRIRDGTGEREGHLQTRLADGIHSRVRLGKRLLLDVGRGTEAFKGVFPVAQAPDGRSEIVGGETRRGLTAALSD